MSYYIPFSLKQSLNHLDNLLVEILGNTYIQGDIMQNTHEYVVTRNFHMGEIKQNLSAGERILFDGAIMTRIKTGIVYPVKSFGMLIAKNNAHIPLLLEDDGTLEFVMPTKREEVSSATSKLIIEDHQDRVVAEIKMPKKNTKIEVKSTEEMAQTKVEDIQKVEIYNDQRVVSTVSKNTKKFIVNDEDAVQENQDFKVILKVDAKKYLAEALAAEGLGGGLNIIADEDAGIIVGKVHIAKENLNTISKTVKVESKLDSYGYPNGYPHNDHWKKRLDWCKEKSDDMEILEIIYSKASTNFRKQMLNLFPDKNLE